MHRFFLCMLLSFASVQGTIYWAISKYKSNSHRVIEDYGAGDVESINFFWQMFGWKDSGIWAVFDGHRNHKCAQFLSENIVSAIQNDEYYPDDIEATLFKVCHDLDTFILAQKNKSYEISGSTGIISVLYEGVLYTANVGDSRAVIGSTGYMTGLSIDHKPSVLSEKKRIENFGGQVDKSPMSGFFNQKEVLRVYKSDNRFDGSLAMSRAFGDDDFKDCGIISKPEITIHNVSMHDDLLILASDGLWDVISNKLAIDKAHQYLKNGSSTLQTAGYLIDWAKGHGSHDDITVIVVDLRSIYGRV